MPAFYNLKANPGQDPDQEHPQLHPYLISSGTMPSRKILEEICHASTFTVPDLEGALVALSEKVLHYLNEGYRVELGHFGYFFATLKSDRPIYDPKKVRSTDIRFGQIHFRPAASFRKKLNGKLQRGRSGRAHQRSSDLSDEVCRTRLLAWLETHPFITRVEYTALTGKLKNIAIRQLRQFVSEGIIVAVGSHSRVVYMLPDRR